MQGQRLGGSEGLVMPGATVGSQRKSHGVGPLGPMGAYVIEYSYTAARHRDKTVSIPLRQIQHTAYSIGLYLVYLNTYQYVCSMFNMS